MDITINVSNRPNLTKLEVGKIYRIPQYSKFYYLVVDPNNFKLRDKVEVDLKNEMILLCLNSFKLYKAQKINLVEAYELVTNVDITIHT